MCGIAGIVSTERENLKTICTQMIHRVKHRGPDANKIWCADDINLALGHARLAIIDLTPTGEQPMISFSGRTAIVFNGEIYNFEELRAELNSMGCRFRGRSDTEILIEGYEIWGIKKLLSKLNGMFAFALWDKSEHKLVLARDRFGEKPLYYSRIGGGFAFASELKSLWEVPGFEPSINKNVASKYFQLGYVPGDFSIFNGVMKLPPGSFLELSQEELFSQTAKISPQIYWSPISCFQNAEQSKLSHQEAVDQLDLLLQDSVRLRMVADVPVGAFLSGGIDSSLVVALMQKFSSRAVKTFSIGFDEKGFNEADYARQISKHLKCDHSELFMTIDHVKDLLPKMLYHFDEPFADYSQFPTYLVSKLAREQVTVVLSGDGGDEIFAGYIRYMEAAKVQSFYSVPSVLRKGAATLLNTLPDAVWSSLANLRADWSERQKKRLAERVRRFASSLNQDNLMGFYNQASSLLPEYKEVAISNFDGGEIALFDDEIFKSTPDFLRAMMLADTVTYLPDDILVKLDRASMAVSLEGRIPILDHRIFEFAATLPSKYFLRDGDSKWLLKQVLYKYCPKEMFNRPKSGFSIPVEHWLKKELKDYADAIFNDNNATLYDFVDRRFAQNLWKEFSVGRSDRFYLIWAFMAFEGWSKSWLDGNKRGGSYYEKSYSVG